MCSLKKDSSSNEIEKIKEQSTFPNSKSETISIETTESACQSCSCVNSSSALFCEECGTALMQPAKCPKCGATARPRADICEVCGTWLLKGQCMFCYSHVEDGETFCGECGNPTDGISCPRCGKQSIFDFCASCGIPLSIQAKEMVRETASNPVFQDMISLFEQLTEVEDPLLLPKVGSAPIKTDSVTVNKEQEDQGVRLKAYRESAFNPATHNKPKSASKPLFSSVQKERINQLNDDVAKEEERRIEEERKRREDEELKRKKEEARQLRLQEQLNEALRKLSVKTFYTNQGARRFFMNLIAGLPEEVARKIINRGMGWRCNAYGCVHSSPNECANPFSGGVWMIL